MNKRPIPKFKIDEELENFINEANIIHGKLKAENELELTKINNINQAQPQVKEDITKDETILKNGHTQCYVKKSLVLKSSIDDALRLESAKTKIKQSLIMQEAIAEFLQKKGYTDI